VRAIYERVRKGLFDYVVVNRMPVPSPQLQRYRAQGAEPVQQSLGELRRMGTALHHRRPAAPQQSGAPRPRPTDAPAAGRIRETPNAQVKQQLPGEITPSAQVVLPSNMKPVRK